MGRIGLLLGFLLGAIIAAPATAQGRSECVTSPNKRLSFCVRADARGAQYTVARDGRTLVQPSALGLVMAGRPSSPATHIERVTRARHDRTWEQPWGEQRLIRDNHREMRVSLGGAGATPYDLVARVFDDGVGFRYHVRSLPPRAAVQITDERTEFNLAGRYDAWWYPARQPDRDEYLYKRAPLDSVTLAETPLTLQGNGVHLSIHEAALVDYASMNLRRTGPGRLKADLMPWSDGVLVRRTGAFRTPWRVMLVGDTPMALADSRLILNLNEPSRIADTSWIKPMKYVGIWWEMHLDRSTWSSGLRHGANNANVRRYIDFAARHGFGGVLVEGWNRGWDGDWVANGEKFSFTQSYPDFDLPALSAYARSKGTSLIGHHETAGAVENYERQLEAAMALYQRHGVGAVKTGYVKPNGTIVRGRNPDGTPQNEWFAGQYRVRHELKVAEVAARHRIAIDAHEPVKDTGLRRTWPNLVSREGARGQEFNAWGRPTNPPEHRAILPFTRLLAGPMDFTPGIFDLTFGKTKVEERVQSTLATQLAEYVVIYSPVHMAADLPENYEKRPDAFQFIKDVPVDWEQSRTLAGVVGDYAVVARQERGGRDWYLGAVNDEVAREVTVPLGFLERGRRYEARIYQDAANADYVTNPHAIEIETRVVTARDRLQIRMARGGGQAIRFRAL